MNNDAEVIRQTLNGNTAAYAQLVERYKQMVFSLIGKVVGNREQAEELAQDTFLKAYKSLAGFRSTSQFSTWLYRIAYNTAISHSRKKQQYFVPLNEQVEKSADDEADEQEKDSHDTQLARLLQLVDELPVDEAALLRLFYWASKSVKEVAEITGNSEANVKVKLHRIRTKLGAGIAQHTKQ